MNNIKRIIAAGLVGTAAITTAVTASAAETKQKSPQEELKGIMADNNVSEALQEKLLKFADAKVVNATQAATVKKDLNSILDAYAAHNYSMSDLQKDEAGFEKVQLIGQDAGDTLGLTYSKKGSNINIFNKGDFDNVIVSFKTDEFSGLLGDTKEEKAAQVANFKTSILPKLTDYMQLSVEDRTKNPTTPGETNPGSTTPEEKDPSYNGGQSEEVKETIKKIEDLKADDSWTDAQKSDFEKAKTDILKMLKNGYILSDLQAAEALVNSLPDGPQKDALLAAIAQLKTFKNDEGETGDEALKATQTPASDESNGGTTAKTATNFGNVAVAGLGLMTVAGAVFVISKKKIC